MPALESTSTAAAPLIDHLKLCITYTNTCLKICYLKFYLNLNKGEPHHVLGQGCHLNIKNEQDVTVKLGIHDEGERHPATHLGVPSPETTDGG